MRDGWVETTLGEVADVIDPHPSHRAPAVDENGIPFIGIGDLRKTGDIDFAKARRVSRDILEEHKSRYDRSEFLIGLGRVASIGMVVRLPDENIEYVVSPTLAVIKAREVMGQFLFYLLEGPHSQEQFQRFKKGSTRESVGMQILRKIKVQVPPLPEQKRIVDLISSVDSYIEALQKQLESAKRSRNAVLHELLTAGGEGWVETTLDGIAEYINGYPFKPSDLGDVGLPVIRIKQLLDPHEPVDRTETGTPDRCLLRDGDIVFSWSGTLAVRIWNRGPAKLNQHLFRVVEKEGVYKGIIPLILDHAIEQLEEKSHGTTMKHITKQTLLPHKVLLPPPPEQKRIVEIINTIDEFISQTELTTSKAQNLRSGLLSDLLSGEHEIPSTYDEVMGAA